MVRLQILCASALAFAGAVPWVAALAEVPRPVCAASGKTEDDGQRQAVCAALSRHLSAEYPDLDPTGLRLVLTRATDRAVSGHIERTDGSARAPDVSVEAQDGPLGPADLDHFAQSALILFLSR